MFSLIEIDKQIKNFSGPLFNTDTKLKMFCVFAKHIMDAELKKQLNELAREMRDIKQKQKLVQELRLFLF